MKPSHIEHIGIAVSSLDEVIPYYEQLLGQKCYSIEEVADQKVKTAFFKVVKQKSNYWNLQVLKALLLNSSKKIHVVVYITLHLM